MEKFRTNVEMRGPFPPAGSERLRRCGSCERAIGWTVREPLAFRLRLGTISLRVTGFECDRLTNRKSDPLAIKLQSFTAACDLMHEQSVVQRDDVMRHWPL